MTPYKLVLASLKKMIAGMTAKDHEEKTQNDVFSGDHFIIQRPSTQNDEDKNKKRAAR